MYRFLHVILLILAYHFKLTGAKDTDEEGTGSSDIP